MTTRFTCRQATAADSEAIAAVFSPFFRRLNFLPMLHTVEEDRGFRFYERHGFGAIRFTDGQDN
jgi:hypothetical protein